MRPALVTSLVIPLALAASTARAAWVPGGSPICTAPGFQGELLAIPAFGSGGPQSMFTLWSDSRDTLPVGSDLYFDLIGVTGPDDPPVDGSPAVTAAGFQGYADACFTGTASNHPPSNAGVVVAWADNRNGPLDVYARRLFDAPPFNLPWPADGVPVCTDPAVQFGIRIAGDAGAGATLAWLDQRTGFNSIYAQRLNADGEPQWSANGVAVCDVPGYRWSLRLAAAPDGGAYFLWTDDRLGNIRAFAMRLLPDGTPAPGWPADGLPVSSLTAFELGSLVPDPAGGIFVTLFSAGVPYACRIDGNGLVHSGWPADGVALAETAFGGGLQDATAFEDGLAVVWVKDIDPDAKGTEYDLIAQRIRGDGTRPTGWGAEGNVLCDVAGDQGGARLASGPILVAVWEDGRPGSIGQDVYCLRLRANGSPDPLWPAGGVAIATGNGRQFSPRPVWDGLGGVMIAYVDDHDFNSLEPDLYAQRVTLAGQVATTAVAIAAPSDFRLSAPVPNPARAAVVLQLANRGAGPVSAEVLDALGRRVRSLAVAGDASTAIRWDLGDAAGRRVEPGIYFVRVRASERVATRAVVVRR